MTPMARMAALSVGSSLAVAAAMLVGALGHPDLALAIAGATAVCFVAGFLSVAGSIPAALRPAREYAQLGYAWVAICVAELLLAAAYVVLLGHIASGALFAVLATGQLLFGAGLLNAARMLRRMPALLAPGEEPRAIALGGNAMPTHTRLFVVATGDRILTSDGRELRLADVERYEADRRTCALTVAGGGTTIAVKPVARPELEKFERLLRAAVTRPGR